MKRRTSSVGRAGRASISWTAHRTIAEHARRQAPKECCGLLVGKDRRVDLALPMTNVDPRPRAGFRIDPAEHLAVRRVLRRLVPSLEIIGVYLDVVAHRGGAVRKEPKHAPGVVAHRLVHRALIKRAVRLDDERGVIRDRVDDDALVHLVQSGGEGRIGRRDAEPDDDAC